MFGRGGALGVEGVGGGVEGGLDLNSTAVPDERTSPFVDRGRKEVGLPKKRRIDSNPAGLAALSSSVSWSCHSRLGSPGCRYGRCPCQSCASPGRLARTSRGARRGASRQWPAD